VPLSAVQINWATTIDNDRKMKVKIPLTERKLVVKSRIENFIKSLYVFSLSNVA